LEEIKEILNTYCWK